jgi:succinyl-CoA synthetase beta subunit
MQITGMYWGAKLLRIVEFPAAEVLGPEASADQIKGLIERHGDVFIKPMFKGGVGKKGKAGLLGRAGDVGSAMKEKARLYFAEHFHNNTLYKAEGVTFEGAVPAENEIYFSITDSTEYRAPIITITHYGGMDVEELPAEKVARIPFDPLTGLKGFVISTALKRLKAPRELISPLVQYLPKLWDLYHHYGM